MNGNSYVGGFVGSTDCISISNSYSTGAVNGITNVGGFVGALGSFNGNISSSYSTGAVNGVTNVGGFVGLLSGTSGISDSYSIGAVTGDSNVGGFLGVSEYSPTYGGNGTISRSYSTGTVTGNSYVGGFAGGNSSTIPSNSYWDIETSVLNTSAGGIGLTDTEMMTQASFTGWDFTNTWSIDEGHDYPKLRNVVLSGGSNSGGDGMTDPGTNPGTGTGDNSGGNTGGSGTNPGTGTGGTGGTGSGTSGGTTNPGNNNVTKNTSAAKSDPSSSLDQKTTTKTKSTTNKSTTTTLEIDHITFDAFGGMTYVSPTFNISKLTGEEIDTLTNNFMSDIKNDIFSKGLAFILAHGLPNLVQDAMDDTIQELLTLVPGVKAVQDAMSLLDGLDKPIDVSHDLSNIIYSDHFNIDSINTPQGPFANADGTRSTYYVTVYPMQQTPPTYGVAIVEITEKKGFWPPWNQPWIPATMTISVGYEVREETFN